MKYLKHLLPALCIILYACGDMSYKESGGFSANGDKAYETSASEGFYPEGGYDDKSPQKAKTGPDEQKQGGEADDKAPPQRKSVIIKTGAISLKTEDYEKSKAAVMQTVKSVGGYVSQESENKSSYQIRNEYVVRIPSRNFDSLLNRLGSLGDQIESKEVSAQDVTQEYLDLETRLNTKRKVLERYYQILKEAKKINDIVLVEDKIRVITEEIEAKEGRLKFLRDRASLSTLRISLYQNFDYAPDDFSFWKSFVKGLKNGWDGLMNFIIGLVNIWPALVIISVLIWFIRKQIIKRRKKQGA